MNNVKHIEKGITTKELWKIKNQKKKSKRKKEKTKKRKQEKGKLVKINEKLVKMVQIVSNYISLENFKHFAKFSNIF